MTRGNRLTNEELEEIRERAEKATEGTWVPCSINKLSHNEWFGVVTQAGGDITDIGVDTIEQNDAAFIAASREDIPKLLAEIERLRESVEYCKQLTGGLTRENAILKGEKPITVHLNGGDDE